MEEAELSTDSFVDIVANTVGILIILALMPIILARLKSVQVDADLGALERMRGNGRSMRRRLAGLSGKAERARRGVDDLGGSVESALETLRESRAILAKVEERTEWTRGEAEARSLRLEELRAGEAHARSELEAAKRSVEESVGPVPAAEMELVRKKSLKELREAVSELRKEADSLAGETKACRTRGAELTRQAEKAEEEKREIGKEIEDLMKRSFVTVEIRDPLASVERTRKPVWIECYVPEKAVDPDDVRRGCVRLVDPTNYAKDGNVLRPRREGESALRILDSDSRYRTYLSGHDAAYKEGHFLYIVLRPDAYATFRLARKLAWEAGWHVAWDPIEEGKVIVMGPR